MDKNNDFKNRYNYAKKLKEELKQEINTLKRKRFFFLFIPSTYILLGLSLIFINYIYSYNIYFRRYGIILIILGVYSLVFFMFMTNPKIISNEERILEIDDELELLEISENQYEKKAEIQFKKHQKEIKRYYDINLGHLKLLFPIGIGIIILGIFIIILSIMLFKDKDVISILIGTISGILTNFVGAIFIKMYIETIKASLKFHNKLIDSNNNLFANVLITKIKNQDLQNATLAEVAKIISRENSNID